LSALARTAAARALISSKSRTAMRRLRETERPLQDWAMGDSKT
jgi:hypothetical protein